MPSTNTLQRLQIIPITVAHLPHSSGTSPYSDAAGFNPAHPSSNNHVPNAHVCVIEHRQHHIVVFPRKGEVPGLFQTTERKSRKGDMKEFYVLEKLCSLGQKCSYPDKVGAKAA